MSDPYKPSKKKPDTGVDRTAIYDDEKTFKHESYAMLSFSRISGHTGPMFGSSLPDQHTFIRLRVNRAERRHHLGRDWYSTAGYPILLELDLSNVQFAELLTNMNAGNGVPCTLRWASDDGTAREMEKPPSEKLEAQQVRDDFKEKTRQVAENMAQSRKKIDEILAKKNISQADRKMVVDLLRLIEQDVHSNMPFWLDQFYEATTKIVTAAKSEIDAFMTHAVMQAGYKALGEGATPPITVPPLLTEGEDDGTSGQDRKYYTEKG